MSPFIQYSIFPNILANILLVEEDLRTSKLLKSIFKYKLNNIIFY